MVSEDYVRMLRIEAAEKFYEWFEEFYRENESKFLDAMEKAARAGTSKAVCLLQYDEDENKGFKNDFMIEKEKDRIEKTLGFRLYSHVEMRILFNERVQKLPREKRRFEYKVFIDFGTERKLKC